MKLVTRYILKQLLVPFVVALFLFTAVLLFIELFHLTDLVINKGVPIRGVLLVLVSRIPETFPFTVPMSLIMAVVMTYGRLSHDNEITALRMAGYSLNSLIVPPLVVGLLFAFVLVGMNQYGLPQLNNYKERVLSRLQLVNPMGLLQPKTYVEIPPYTIYADRIEGGVMKNVWIEDRSQSPPQIIVSQRGEWVKQSEKAYKLVLENGTLHQKGQGENYRVLQFNRQVLNFQPGGGSSSSRSTTSKTLYQQYRSYRALAARLDRRQRTNAGEKKIEKTRKNFLEKAIQFHRSVALPFASFFLVFLTAPAGMLTKNYGKIVDLIVCLGTFLVYYLGLSLMEPLAMVGSVPPGVAMWLPNLFFGILGFGTIVYLKRIGG